MKYLQVDDKFFKITLNDKGAPEVTAMAPQEEIDAQFEKIVLEPTTIDTSLFQTIIDRTRDQMEVQLEGSLKSLVLSSLGFSYSNNNFIISGFNDRDSVVGKHLASKMQNKVLNMDLDKEFGLTPAEKGKLKIAMTNKFKETYKDYINNMVWKYAKSLAEDHAREIVKEFANDKLKAVAKALLEQAVYENKYAPEKPSISTITTVKAANEEDPT